MLPCAMYIISKVYRSLTSRGLYFQYFADQSKHFGQDHKPTIYLDFDVTMTFVQEEAYNSHHSGRWLATYYVNI